MGHHTEAFVGIDTSKLRNAVAIAESGRGGEVRYLGEFPAKIARLSTFLCGAHDGMTPEQFDRLAATVDAMTNAQSRGDWMRHRQQLQLYYDILREASGNPLRRAQNWMR